jgi:hypothetical protein
MNGTVSKVLAGVVAFGQLGLNNKFTRGRGAPFIAASTRLNYKVGNKVDAKACDCGSHRIESLAPDQLGAGVLWHSRLQVGETKLGAQEQPNTNQQARTRQLGRQCIPLSPRHK